MSKLSEHVKRTFAIVKILKIFHPPPLARKNWYSKLVNHQRVVCEGVKYTSKHCGNQFSSKGDVAKHQRVGHKVLKYPRWQCGEQFLLNTKGQYMKESNILAGNVVSIS